MAATLQAVANMCGMSERHQRTPGEPGEGAATLAESQPPVRSPRSLLLRSTARRGCQVCGSKVRLTVGEARMERGPRFLQPAMLWLGFAKRFALCHVHRRGVAAVVQAIAAKPYEGRRRRHEPDGADE